MAYTLSEDKNLKEKCHEKQNTDGEKSLRTIREQQ
jgi:hypothetical protein